MRRCCPPRRAARVAFAFAALASAAAHAEPSGGELTAEPDLSLPPGYEPLRSWEYVVAPALLTYAFTARFAFELGEENMGSDILFDESLQTRVSVEDETYRDIMTPLGDIGFIPMMAYRFADSWAVAGAWHGRWDIATQMFFIDMEGYGLTAAVIWSLQHLLRKKRPRNEFCEPPFDYRDGRCSPGGDDRSFVSGHLASAVTGASLTCLHHTHLPLYGGGAADATACGAAIGLAALTGVSRLTTDAHYFTDVLLGAALGFLGGYVVPKTLHYGWGDVDPVLDDPETRAKAAEGEDETAWIVAPTFEPGGGGRVSLMMTF